MTDTVFLTDAVVSYVDPARDLNPIDDTWRASPGRRRVRLGPLISPEMALERALRRATAQNARQHTSRGHEPAPLYGMAEDCGHTNPDTLDAADGIDDLIDAEHERRHPGDTWRAEGYHARQREVRQSFIIARLLDEMDDIYSDKHSGYVCLDDPQGYACAECDKEDLEYGEGVESSGCRRISDARETWDEFWYFQASADRRDPALAEEVPA